jgi:hypothetical protein
VEIIGEIMSWVSNSNGELLWLNGIPGSGKSTLMSTIADCARKMGKHSRLGAFVRFDSKTMKDSSHVITTLAYELAEFDDRIGDKISQAIKANPDIADWLLDEQFQELIVKPLELVKDLKDEGPIVVLADALEKLELCDTRTELLKVLAGGFGANLPFMRLIMSSQPQAEIVSIFDSAVMQHIYPYPLDVSSGDVIQLNRLDRDIRLYFEHKFREINNPEFHELCHQHDAITKLTERACGRFIQASKIAQFIKSSPTKRLLTVLNASGPTVLEAALDSDSISPGTTSATAIPAINATYGTVNIVGRDQTNITNNFYVDRDSDQGIWRFNLARQRLIAISVLVYQWLSAVIPSANYHGALRVRLEDTGLWFIDGARFAQWKATVDDFVWICGTRMYSHHLRIIIVSKSVLQLVQARLS